MSSYAVTHHLQCFLLSFPASHDIFGDVSSSEDEDEKDINIMDSGEEDLSMSASMGPDTPGRAVEGLQSDMNTDFSDLLSRDIDS